jgi:uncharacterized protein with NRDE domain
MAPVCKDLDAMCLIALGFHASRDYSFALAANRDERHSRPTATAEWWPDGPSILGGRDLVAGGSWLAVDRRGRAAAVTNYFEAGGGPGVESRGELVAGFLRDESEAHEFSAKLEPSLESYGGFNLLLFDGRHLQYASNRAPARELGNGIHAFGNADPGADWPKIRRARAGFTEWLESGAPLEALFDLLGEQSLGAAGAEAHRRSLFIRGSEFGTRCSTILLVRRDGAATFVERRFDATGEQSGESRYEFELETAPGTVRDALIADAP